MTTPTVIDNFNAGPALGAAFGNTNASSQATGLNNTIVFAEIGRVGATGFCIQFDNGGTNSSYMEHLTAFTGTRAVYKGRVRFEALEHTSDWRFANPRTATANNCHLCLNPEGIWTLRDAGGVSLAGSASSTPGLIDTNYDWILAVTPGTTTTTGELEYWILAEDSETVLHTRKVSNINAGVAMPDRIRSGTNAVLPGGGRHWMDRLAIESLATGRIIEGTVNTPPTITADTALTSQEPGSIITTGCIASDVDGSIASFTCTAPGLVFSETGLANKRTFEGPIKLLDQTYTITWTVTDNSGATASATQQVTVLAATILVAQGGVHVPAILRA